LPLCVCVPLVIVLVGEAAANKAKSIPGKATQQ